MRWLLVASLLTFATAARASTWEEPWHKDVVTQADSFGLYKAEAASETKASFILVKHLAGDETGKEVTVDGFYALDPVVFGKGRTLPLLFEAGNQYYLFIKHGNSKDSWSIATNTSGFAKVAPEGVVATYRIAMHQAYVPPDVYEMTQTCIFNHLHGLACTPDTQVFINKEVAYPVAELSENAAKADMDRFFLQHAALETAYLIKYPISLKTLSKFLASGFFHVQIAAVRALSASGAPERNQMLLSFAEDTSKNIMARIMAVVLIKDLNARELKPQLAAYMDKGPDEGFWWGRDIMDPRLAPDFPGTVQVAIDETLKAWN